MVPAKGKNGVVARLRAPASAYARAGAASATSATAQKVLNSKYLYPQ